MITGNDIRVSRQCKVIEFFGLPGVGKTYLAGKLCLRLKSEHQQVGDSAILIGHSGTGNRLLKKSWLILAYLWANRTAYKCCWRLIMLYKPLDYLAGLKLIFNWLFVCALIRSEASNTEIVVLDQGVGQALWSTHFYGINIPDSRMVATLFISLIHDLPIAQWEMFHVTADSELIKNRIGSRVNGHSPLDRNSGLWGRALAVTYKTREILDLAARSCDSIAIANIVNNGQA